MNANNNNYELYTGIDLGTTNSAIAIAESNGRRLNTPVLEVERRADFNRGGKSRKRDSILPSAVMYYENEKGNFDIYVGDCAKEMAKTRPFAVAMSIKEQLGEPSLRYPHWNSNYPDKTPQDVASRIISALLDGAEDTYGERPEDVVITIPASYSPIKRIATLKAAEKAGLKVKNSSGEYRNDILLSEPEAVTYHVLNQHQNGDISLMCNFEEPKRVMVYDIGGGTLDITIHEVRQSPDNPDSYEMKQIATNRFSSIAGNTIDKAIAEYMYQNYIEELKDTQSSLAAKVKLTKDEDMPFFERMAEEVKISFSDKISERSKRGRKLPPDAFESYGGIISGGNNMESSITLKEFEDCIMPFMGNNYKYEDYKNFKELPEENNIIYPVLQVLWRASVKLNEPDFKVDMVILNGGMSRLYLVKNRLAEFFGFHMTTVNDPDTSVAQGAAVYHYYRSKLGHTAISRFDDSEEVKYPGDFVDITPHKIISKNAVLPEDIYLGLRAGSRWRLAEAGVDLPYERDDLPTFTLPYGSNHIEIPIREIHGDEEVTIGRGRISFYGKYRKDRNDTKVHVKISINRSGILSFEADSDLGSGKTDILLGEEQSSARKGGKTLNPPTGAALIPANELSSLKDMVKSLARQRNPQAKKNLSEKIRQNKENMKKCGNPEEFAEPLLKMLSYRCSTELFLHLAPIARIMCPHWTQEQRAELSSICVQQLSYAIRGYSVNPTSINPNTEAIKTIGVCGITKDCEVLKTLQWDKKYHSALLFAYGTASINYDWIFSVLKNNYKSGASVQDAVYALGRAFYNAPEDRFIKNAWDMAAFVLKIIRSSDLDNHAFVISLITMAEIISRKSSQNMEKLKSDALFLLKTIRFYYSPEMISYAGKALSISENLLKGISLTADDDRYLLSLMDSEN